MRSQILEKLATNPEKKEIPLFVKALKENDVKLHSPAVVALERLTQQKLGKSSQKVSEKRMLWIEWARTHSNEIIN